MKNKVVAFLSGVFSLGLLLCMIASFAAACSFALALLLGGPAAESICAFLKSTLLPAVFTLGTIVSFVGIIKMYLNGEKSFILEKPKKQCAYSERLI